MLEAIKKRRSIRRYTNEPVSDEHINTLLDAAMAAPSGHGLAPWEFVVVRDQELRRQLSKVHQWSSMAADAPVVFVICGNEKLSVHWIADCSAATENLLLQATDLGLGAVWVGIMHNPASEREVRNILNIPSTLRVLCIIPVGHPAEQKQPHTGHNPSKVHYDKY